MVPEGPAEKEGLKEGDVIVKVNDQDIGTIEDLRRALKAKEVGEEVTLVIVREGELQTVRVKLGEMPRE